MIVSPPPATRLVASTGNDYNYTDYNSSSQNSDWTSEDGTRSSVTQDSDSNSEEGSQSSAARDSNSTSEDSARLLIARDYDSGNFRSLYWSSDGTSLVTTSADNTLRTFILPPDLLEPNLSGSSETGNPNHHSLVPYSSHSHPTSTYATVLSPYYAISAPETTLILTSPSSLPIRLISPFAPGILATYPLVNSQTEKWIASHSLLFSVTYNALNSNIEDRHNVGSSLRFLAGSQNQISLFDVSRDGAGPMTTLATAPGNRKARRGGNTGMAGLVSALAMSCDGILAAGTFSRGLGLYDSQGMGDTIGTWSLTGSEDASGVTNLHWTRCGRYLVVAERDSDGMGVWDIRGTGKRLAWLAGRNACTMQRLGVALGFNSEPQYSEDVYAGGMDGCVRVWNQVGMKEGVLESDWQWQAHEDVVSGLGVHACGSVVATCSGSREDLDAKQTDAESGSEDTTEAFERASPPQDDIKKKDNSIRVWSLDHQSSSPSRDPF